MKAKTLVLALLAACGLIAGTTAQAAISFEAAKIYPTGDFIGPGPSADSMDTADFNNDGNAHLVIASPYLPFSTPVVMLGKGDGSFGPPIRIAVKLKDPATGLFDMPYLYATQSVGVGDIDRDGNADISVQTGPFVAVLLGRGDGSFRAGDTKFVALGGQLFSPLLDTNSDGRLDLVTGTVLGITTFLGDGRGELRGSYPFTLNSPLLGVSAALRQTRLNGDRYPDIAVLDGALQGVVLMKGNGNGTFSKVRNLRAGVIPEDVAVADLDGDGVDDYVTANSFSFDISVFLSGVFLSDAGREPFARTDYADIGREGPDDDIVRQRVAQERERIDRSLTTQAPAGLADLLKNSTFVPGPVAVRIADLDNDGDPDIVVSSVVGIWQTVFENDGTGKLVNRQDLPSALLPQTPVLADFDKDGKIDIAVAGAGGLAVLINNSR
ncbi:FG-GAP repeat domain-containing protein [Lysobacter sp. CA199]|uniref:FG-GAP repeat domain-containing protein n=1 Tax=Lysobacter sp. CA199 TaxID=3455608 RepID=UPI003F8D5431